MLNIVSHGDTSLRVAACAWKNTVVFGCVFGHRLDDCCRLLIFSFIDSATLNNDHSTIKEQDNIGIPMLETLQSTEHEAYASWMYFLCGNAPLFISIVFIWRYPLSHHFFAILARLVL